MLVKENTRLQNHARNREKTTEIRTLRDKIKKKCVIKEPKTFEKEVIMKEKETKIKTEAKI